MYGSAGHCSLKEFVYGCILVIPWWCWGSSCLLSAVAPAQGLEAATQRVQYCWGLSLHALDSPSFSVTWAAGAKACNKLSGLMVLEALLWSHHALWLGPKHVHFTFKIDPSKMSKSSISHSLVWILWGAHMKLSAQHKEMNFFLVPEAALMWLEVTPTVVQQGGLLVVKRMCMCPPPPPVGEMEFTILYCCSGQGLH